MRNPHHNGQRVSRLAPLSEVWSCLDGLARRAAPQDVAVEAARGRVLAADVIAPVMLPTTAVALRDGWAVRSEVLSDAGSYAPVIIAPPPDRVDVGTAMPDATDAVIPPDAVTLRAGVAEALMPAVAGDGVLAAGSDAAPGQMLRRAGEVLRAVDVAVLQAAGLRQVCVRAPSLRIVCATAAIEEDRDTVGRLIAAAIEADGGRAQVAFVGLGGESRLVSTLGGGGDVDAVIGIGGTGMGRHDVSVAALGRIGKVAIHGIGLAPGDTAAIGAIGTRPVLLLPGRLDAALAAYLVVGRHLLTRLTGRAAGELPVRAMLGRKIVSTIGIAEVVLVRHNDAGIEPVASGIFPLHAMARADGYVLVPAELEGYQAGTVVEMQRLP
jgi:molybdopterin molybdotransferase